MLVTDKVIILGLGNPLLSDEGLGIHVIQYLQTVGLPEKVQLVDGGTAGLLLLNCVEAAEKLLVVDAIDAQQPGGTVIQVHDIPQYSRHKLSPHQAGFQEVLTIAAMQGRLPGEIHLLGIQPHALTWGCALSAPVYAALEELLTLIKSQLSAWGIPVQFEPTPNANAWGEAGQSDTGLVLQQVLL